tara:strand:+ start:132 stop:416 length:285 start_codon:yes stop_codon:yes gene_type:complete
MKKSELRQIIRNILKEEPLQEQALSDFVLSCTGGNCICDCVGGGSTTCPAPCGSTCGAFCTATAPITPDKSFAGMNRSDVTKTPAMNKKLIRRK